MTQLPPTFGTPLPARAPLAAALSLAEHDLVQNLPVQVVSTGVPYVLVPLDSRAVVDRAVFEPASYARFQQEYGLEPTTCVYLFTLEGAADGVTAYSRMFGAGLGISEDPATGSAAGPLGAYLVHHGLKTGRAAADMRVLQGVHMGRRSEMQVSIDASEAKMIVRVGGTAVLAGEGTLYLS
jgi:trans-2,3-dihydro-3-hydroxyanthranilate isomerase